MEVEEALERVKATPVHVVNWGDELAGAKTVRAVDADTLVSEVERLRAVNARAEELLRPFARWWIVAGHYGTETLQEEGFASAEVETTGHPRREAELRWTNYEAAAAYFSPPIP